MYSAALLDHFENPRNAGELEGATARVRVENPVCGDILEIALRIEHERVVEIRFRAKGCVPAIACGSAVTELALGKRIEEASELRSEEIIAFLGGIPAASGHAAALAAEALRRTLRSASTLVSSR